MRTQAATSRVGRRAKPRGRSQPAIRPSNPDSSPGHVRATMAALAAGRELSLEQAVELALTDG